MPLELPGEMRAAALLLGLASVATGAGCSDGPGVSKFGATDVSSPANGRQLVTLSTPGEAFLLQVDSANAYVETETSVLQIPFSGAAPITLGTVNLESAGLAVVGPTVYWDDYNYSGASSPSEPQGILTGAPIGGGQVTTLATGQGLPSALAADSTNLYWLNLQQCPTPTTCGSAVMSMPVGGGTPVVVASVTPSTPNTIAIDASNVYWGTNDGRIEMVPKHGGTPTLLADYETTVAGMVVSGSSVYWLTSGGDLMQTPTGGGPSTAIVVGTDSIVGLAADSTNVYFATGSDPFETSGDSPSTIQKVPLGGGSAETLWTGTDTPEAIQVDGTSLYFTTALGAVNKLTPK